MIPLPKDAVQRHDEHSSPVKTLVELAASLPAAWMKCCYPLGEPGTRSFRFCENGAVPGKAYCDMHARIVYVKIGDDRGAVG